jgi:hypothetical protein
MSIADGLFEFSGVVVREVLGGRIGERDELLFADSAMREDSIDDLAGVVSAGEEQDDGRLRGLDVDAGGVDPGADVPGRLSQQLESLDLLLDLLSRLE